tara:strand:+ start:12717 stop:13562 length:846 start_codon:yes stop_codon:yes gene_type:complete
MEIKIENKIFINIFKNNDKETKKILKEIGLDQIQFHFNIDGHFKLKFNENYEFNLIKNKCIIIYNSKKKVNLNAELKKNSTVITILIPLSELHKLLSNQDIYIPTIINIKEKYYEELDLSKSLIYVLNQISNSNKLMNTQKLFLKAKIYETFSLLFKNNNNSESCPFTINNDILSKIRLAKEILIKDVSNTPTLNELSENLKISLKKLKQGFKEVYGFSVYQYALNYKLEYAKDLLISGKHNVNEISIIVGYSSSSHFIAAFKKKYHLTPFNFIKNISVKS